MGEVRVKKYLLRLVKLASCFGAYLVCPISKTDSILGDFVSSSETLRIPLMKASLTVDMATISASGF